MADQAGLWVWFLYCLSRLATDTHTHTHCMTMDMCGESVDMML